jgi:hypothetical protein
LYASIWKKVPIERILPYRAELHPPPLGDPEDLLELDILLDNRTISDIGELTGGP